MNRLDVLRQLIPIGRLPVLAEASAFAPINIALIKYWGKRNEPLFLPVTDSISISFAEGTYTTIRVADQDSLTLNGQAVIQTSPFYTRLFSFLNEVRDPTCYCAVETRNDMATGAGLASSASGFAALVLACDQLFGWHASKTTLSIVARMCSGSSCRSIFSGFVHWRRGEREDGLDSYAQSLSYVWPDLCCGVLLISDQEKPISSSYAMRHTVETSPLYRLWPTLVYEDSQDLLKALETHDFAVFGRALERNSCTMHAIMHAASPPIVYWLPDTLRALSTIWKARDQGLPLYATMDAGPNIKVFFQSKDSATIQQLFPAIRMISLHE